MRNLYVAMSRPTRFLCLATNESRVDAQALAALAVSGWDLLRDVKTVPTMRLARAARFAPEQAFRLMSTLHRTCNCAGIGHRIQSS